MRNDDQTNPISEAVARYAANMRAAGMEVTVTEVAPGQVRVSGRDPRPLTAEEAHDADTDREYEQYRREQDADGGAAWRDSGA